MLASVNAQDSTAADEKGSTGVMEQASEGVSEHSRIPALEGIGLTPTVLQIIRQQPLNNLARWL